MPHMRDPEYSRFKKASRREPRLELLKTCWRFIDPSQRIFECGIYRTDLGLEVRVGYGPEDLLRSQFAIEISAARDIASDWNQAVIAKGFTELSAT
jgi:hypothetical protein